MLSIYYYSILAGLITIKKSSLYESFFLNLLTVIFIILYSAVF